jgi:hypothetical protein
LLTHIFPESIYDFAASFFSRFLNTLGACVNANSKYSARVSQLKSCQIQKLRNAVDAVLPPFVLLAAEEEVEL